MEENLKSEVIRVRGNLCYVQVFEINQRHQRRDAVEFTGDLLVVEFGRACSSKSTTDCKNPFPTGPDRGLF